MNWSHNLKVSSGICKGLLKIPTIFIADTFVIFFSEGVPVDGDDPAHVQWIYDKAKERADSFNIQGVTYRLTQGNFN